VLKESHSFTCHPHDHRDFTP